ncbi:MAG TPA: hypothetical protein VFU55_06880 [Terracidiphilus sp.]|nr:hypothetical protein [Terracidiphilus sp.]
MDTTVRIFKSKAEMKAEELRYWQSRPAHERMEAVSSLTHAAYAMKDPETDVRRLQSVAVCLQRPQR